MIYCEYRKMFKNLLKITTILSIICFTSTLLHAQTFDHTSNFNSFIGAPRPPYNMSAVQSSELWYDNHTAVEADKTYLSAPAPLYNMNTGEFLGINGEPIDSKSLINANLPHLSFADRLKFNELIGLGSNASAADKALIDKLYRDGLGIFPRVTPEPFPNIGQQPAIDPKPMTVDATPTCEERVKNIYKCELDPTGVFFEECKCDL